MMDYRLFSRARVPSLVRRELAARRFEIAGLLVGLLLAPTLAQASSMYRIDVLAATGDLAPGSGSIVRLGLGPSINDLGTVAFTAGVDDGREAVFVADEFGLEERSLLADSFFYSLGSQVSNVNDNYWFDDFVQINNQDQVAWRARPRDGLIGFLVRQGPSGDFKLIAKTHYPSLDSISPFEAPLLVDALRPAMSLNNQVGGISRTLFSAIPRSDPSITVLATPVDPELGGNSDASDYHLSNGAPPGGVVALYPMVTDANFVLVRGGGCSQAGAPPCTQLSPLLLFNNESLTTAFFIAEGPDFLAIGDRPGISDDTVFIAFMGHHVSQGVGIFGELGAPPFKVAGLAGDGILDPGETWNDLDTDGVVDPGEDSGLFSSFSLLPRVGVNRSEEGSTDRYTVVFAATSAISGEIGLYSTEVDISGASPVVATARLIFELGGPLIESGGLLEGNLDNVAIYDPVNNGGEIAAWVHTDAGAQAIVRARVQEIDLVDPACVDATSCAGQYLVEDGGTYRIDDAFPNLLAEAEAIRTAIATDGVSQLLIRIPTDEPVTLSLLSPLGSAAGPEYGTLLELNGTPAGNSLTVTPTPTDSGNFAFAGYKAPANFPGSLFGVLPGVDIGIRADSNVSSSTWNSKLTLRTPPVMLVHGVWSNAGAWAGLETFLERDGFRVCDSCRVDYGMVAPAGSFDPDATTPIDRYAVNSLMLATGDTLTSFRRDGIAVSQVDVVGHSMGGLVARARVARSDGIIPYEREENYGQGSFHKIITVGTPHFGSPLADWFLEHRCENVLWGALGTLEEAFASRGRPLGPGIEELRPGSSALRALGATMVPTHSIVGIAPTSSFTEWALNIAIRTTGSSDEISDLLGGVSNHDTIVPTNSQEGSLLAASHFPDLVHADLGGSDEGETDSLAVWLRVQQLLLAELGGGLFDVVDPPVGPPSAPPTCPAGPSPPAPLGEGVATLNPPPGTGAAPGEVVTLDLSIAGGNAVDGALFFVGLDVYLEPGPGPFSLQVTVPDDQVGPLDILADTYGPGPQNYSSSTQLIVSAPGMLESLKAIPDEVVLFEIGQLFQLRVLGEYDDGSSPLVGSDAAGTSYSLLSGTSDVVALLGDGLLEAVGSGSDVLIVENGGKVVSVPIAVPEPSRFVMLLVGILGLAGLSRYR